MLVQCIIPIEWLILVHPTAQKWTDSMVHDYWWCDPYDEYDVGLVLSFIFVMFLVLLTGIFAALAWDSENNNKESRWILAASIITAGERKIKTNNATDNEISLKMKPNKI